MKLTPQQAPLYGQCVITVQLADEELAVDEEGVDYFLLFSGSTQRHLTSTQRSNHDTLQALCPAHDCCEAVSVTLCAASRGAPEDPAPCRRRVAPRAEQRFSFVQDLAYDMAQFLVSTAGRADGLDGALLLDECQIPLQECERLDESLALALRHLALPPGWSLLGRRATSSTELNPQETLLHFSARRGLWRVTDFLLRQPGAKGALRLLNREGLTPAEIAAQRGHQSLHELLTKAEADADTEADAGTESAQPVSADARVACHHPRLNTHTLTVRTQPGRDPAALQRSVEQLLHLICHLHAKQGDSVLELQLECLHTAAECPDGVEREITSPERAPPPALASQCLDKTTAGSWIESCSVGSDSGGTGSTERDCSSPGSGPPSEVPAREHGPGPTGERPCLISEPETDSCQARGEGGEQPAVSTRSVSLCDRSEEGAQIGAAGDSLAVGTPPPVDSVKQAEETDRGEAAIGEGQEVKGKEAPEQETEDRTVRRREEEEQQQEEEEVEDQKTLNGDEKLPVMGQTPSSELSDASDSEAKEAESCGKEGMKLCDGLPSDNAGDEELTVALSAPEGLRGPSLINCGDVIKGPESSVPRLLIEGLHEGEPPPDTNSLEQNQETAVGDYATEQRCASAPETVCHSGNCTGTSAGELLRSQGVGDSPGCSIKRSSSSDPGSSMEDIRTDPSLQKMPGSAGGITDPDSGVPHCLSSDDDCSFRSVGSSTTEIFHPTLDGAGTEDQDCPPQPSSTGFSVEETNHSQPGGNNEHSAAVEPGGDSAGTVKDCSHAGTEPDSQLSPRQHTMEALNSAGTGEELVPDLSKEDLSLGPALSESGSATMVKVRESETGESGNSDPNTGLHISTGAVAVDDQPEESSDRSASDSAGEGEDVRQDHSEMMEDQRSADVPSSRGLTSPEALNGVSSDPDVEEETILDTDGQTAFQELEVIVSEGTEMGEEEEDNGLTDETDFSRIHRDREASFHQPCNALHSGPSLSPVSPSLPSRASSSTSCPSAAHRDSSSDLDSYLSAEPGYESIFRKSDEPVTGGDSASEVSVSCSSTDDTASVGPSSSSPEGSQGLECSWSPEEGVRTGAAISAGLDGGAGGGGGGAVVGEAEEEAKDRVTEVPRRSCLLRNSRRSLSPLRRHSWGPGKNNGADAEMNQRSYSLEGLSGGQEELRGPTHQGPRILEPCRLPRHDSDDRGSLVSLTEEQEELEDHSRLRDPKSRRYRPLRNSCPPMSLPLTKSVSMLAISQRDIDVGRLRRKRRISFSFNLSPILNKSKSQVIYGDSSSSDDDDDDDNTSMRSLAYSISEEEPGPLRSDTEGKSATKVSRTFSYLKNKMYKKTREKDREKKEKEGKEKDKKTINGHLFTAVSSAQAGHCSQCNKAFTSKEAYHCTHCNASVHKGCRDSLPVCAKVKMKLPKQQFAAPDSSSLPTVTMRNKSGGTRERPWSAILCPEDHSSLTLPSSRRHTSIMAFHGNNLSKSLSISNIAGPVFDEIPIKGLRYLSQSTDSLNRTNQVTESMESLTDEGTEMMDGQLMGEFEAEAKEMEADSWSLGVEQQYLQQLDRELVKRQDVIYELMQTEMHHIRTLRIMSEVYSKGLQKELQLELQTLEKLFPALDELLDLHTQHLLRLLERKRESQLEGGSAEGSFVISRIGDILVNQFSGYNGESMKRVYGRFCSRHNEAVNFYKDLLTKDKRFKAFIKKKMSSSIVRRLSIPECILLVTQRITKYPVLIQRMLQHTKEGEDDYEDLTEAVRLVKEVIAAVDSKVNEHEKRRRLKEFHSRTDSKSIMMMKSGQIFAREDLLRRRLIHDGMLQLKNSQGRLKDVHALLLSDVFVFLQEKDQKYIFAMLDQRSTVISLQKLIVREVANEERGLFLITAGIEKPEMMEVLASSKEERNTWIQLIQEAMQSMEKDEDEGIPSETEDDKRQLETKAKEMRDLLKQKDTEIMSLLEEKVQLFRGMWEGLNPGEEVCRQVDPFFRSSSTLEPPRGVSVMKEALQEVETLQALVNGSLGGAMASVQEGGGGGGGGGGAGPVCLPRRAETFGGFDSHQMHSSKSGDREEGEDSAGDLRRTESDSVLKKGGNANVLLLLKRNSEQVLHSVSNLHLLLSTLQAVVVQQDSFIEDQRQALSERSSSCASLSRPSSRPSSLIEQEKQRSLEKQRQELASLQRQQAAHADEKRRREREWELREQRLSDREGSLREQEEEILRQQRELEEERQELQSKKEEYQRDLERLRDAQRKLDRDREAVQRQLDRMEEVSLSERTPSTTSDESQFPGSSQSLELDPLEFSSTAALQRLQPQRSKPKGKGLNPFTSSSSNTGLKGGEPNNQISKSLLQLAKSKSKDGKEKDKKKKKGKAGAQSADPQHLPEPPLDGEIFFC